MKRMDGIIIGGIAISVVLGMIFVLQPATSQEKQSQTAINGNSLMSAESTSEITHNEKMGMSHSPPDPFKITVNGHAEPALVATVQRGQTSQVDVFISPKYRESQEMWRFRVSFQCVAPLTYIKDAHLLEPQPHYQQMSLPLRT